MEGQILIERWLRSDRTLAQSPVYSFDQGEIVWCDRTLRGERLDTGCQRPVDSSKVPERENRDRTRPVSANWMLPASGHTVNSRVRGCTDQSVRSI